MGTIHAMYLNRGKEAFFTTSVLNQIHSKIIIPCFYAFIPLITYYSLTSFKKNKYFIIIATIDIFLYMVSTGARAMMIFLLADVILVLGLIKIKETKKTYDRIKKIGMIVFAVLLLGVILYTIFRKNFSSTGENVIFQLFEEIYKYISLCIPLSDVWLDKITSEGIITYGKMSSFGALSTIEWIFVQFFRVSTFQPLQVCKNLAKDLEVMYPIFSNAQCNAFVTYAFYFYADFRTIGVIIGSFLWGLFTGKICKKVNLNNDIKTITFYLLFAQTITMSYSRWILFDSAYILALIFLRFIFIKEKKIDTKLKGYFLNQRENDIILSIYMTTFNHEKYIKKAIDSILMQKTNYKYEIIIGDDCSQDDTQKILKQYEKMKIKNLKIFYRKKNMGNRGANNLMDLMQKCKGKYIIALEGDDYWTDEYKIEKQIKFLEENPTYIAVAHNCTVVDENSNINNEKYPECKDNIYTIKHFFSNILPGQLTTVMCRNIFQEKSINTDLLNQGLFPADRLLYFILISYGNIYCIQESMSAYRQVLKNGSSFSANYVWDYNIEKKWYLALVDYTKEIEKYELKKYTELLLMKVIIRIKKKM